MHKPRILLAMITAGNGHKAPAEALRAGLEKLYPGQFEIDVLDFAAEIGDTIFDKFTKDTWNWMLRHPWSAYYGQLLLEWVVPRALTRWFTARMLRHHARNAAFFVRGRYDLLVSTHYFTVQALSDARRKFKVTMPLVGICTDPFDGHVLWADEHADEIIVNSPRAKRTLERNGVRPERVRVFGYPLGLQFTAQKQDRASAREELGLQPGQLTVLQSAGGEGQGGQLEDFVQAVLEADLDVQYVVACGRNEKLLERLNDLKAQYPHSKTHLEPRGYISNMHTYLAATDVVLGKAGASTTLEALATGHPMFHTSFVNQSEKTNVEFCVEHRVGRYLPEPEDLVRTLRRFLEHPADLERLRANVAALELEVGTLEIARHLIETHLPWAVEARETVQA
jgi:UDP-N-acetylglucosamine:LPS N-acetylglucosamine transferase